ncbi:uncharacterized protein A4U43_C10F110 [Asparagus officinalis]|uniref:Flavin-containing monooxygenase n=1 Tax=Asparagus officinalis TaxID=4686 RepID=A0A5P1DZE8_ASPOF|nr:flavin-containing monooxygenase FMO GS-OX-like 3 [Asparagus officinalis]ONK55700.1 uncharacterized protein A4U43_C10F110 [Asparagus officinalis]
MGFFDYPFVAVEDGREGDSRRFPRHQEVLRYLEDFARDFEVLEVVRFRTEVVRVEMEEEGKWAVRWRRVAAGEDGGGEITGGGEDQVEEEEEEEIYDGVVVCNGHYTEPRLAAIPGIDIWPGKQMHSHNYRVPEPFRDQVVVIIGSAASAVDISNEIAQFAKEVHVASRSDTEGTPKRQPGYGNLWLHSMIESTHEDGTVVFQDGSSTHVDVIMHCTGYKYHFPFLQTHGIVTVDDNRVGPLYKHVFPPALVPYLSFIGIPWKVAPFPLVELQSKWVAAVLSGRVSLPTRKVMMEDVDAFYKELETAGYPKRYTHIMTNYQYEYIDWLANECGYPPTEEWRKLMYKATSKNRKERPGSYRDEWDDDHLVAQAHEYFKRFFK